MMQKLKDFFRGTPFTVEEKLHYLEERAQHLRKHINNMNARLDHIEVNINLILEKMEKK